MEISFRSDSSINPELVPMDSPHEREIVGLGRIPQYRKLRMLDSYFL